MCVVLFPCEIVCLLLEGTDHFYWLIICFLDSHRNTKVVMQNLFQSINLFDRLPGIFCFDQNVIAWRIQFILKVNILFFLKKSIKIFMESIFTLICLLLTNLIDCVICHIYTNDSFYNTMIIIKRVVKCMGLWDLLNEKIILKKLICRIWYLNL